MSIHAAPDEIMGSLLEKLYKVLGGGDGQVANDANSFIAFCLPGIPKRPEAFLFAGDWQTFVAGEDGDEVKQGNRQTQINTWEEQWAHLANFVPRGFGLGDATKKNVVVYKPDTTSLWQPYRNVLDHAEVPINEPTDDEKSRIARFQGALRTKVSKPVDLQGTQTRTDFEDSEILRQYYLYKKKYSDAWIAYTNAMISQYSSKADAQRWKLQGTLLESNVDQARHEWESSGNKSMIEGMQAYVDQITRRNMLLYLQHLRDVFQNSIRTGQIGPYHATSVLSNEFAQTDEGWTKFTFTEQDLKTFSSQDSMSYAASGGLSLGLFRIGGRYGESRDEQHTKLDADGFEMSFGLCQVPILRPWFAADFLRAGNWKWAPGSAQLDLSDGKIPPSGQMPGYPTSAIFLRDLNIKFANWRNQADFHQMTRQGGGGVGWGLFAIGGNYSQHHGDQAVESSSNSQGMSVKGMQLIGFECTLLGKSPNPVEGVFPKQTQAQTEQEVVVRS